jgi:hypothetical protein
MESIEVMPPVASSPLDSMRGRGKRGGISHQNYTTSEKKHPKGNKSIVILMLPENTSKPIVGHKQ